MSTRKISPESTLDISDLSDAFVESLSDVSCPTHCATFYVQYLEFLCGKLIPVMRADRHDIFNTCMRFLTHARADAELHKLEKSILKCSCDSRHRCIHETATRTRPARWNATLQGVFEGCAIVVRLCFGRYDSRGAPQAPLTLDQAMKKSQKAEKRGQKTPWPFSARDIFVNSPEQTLFVMWRLCYHYKSAPILKSLESIVGPSGSILSLLFYKMPAFPRQFIEYFEAELARLVAGAQDLDRLTIAVLVLYQSAIKCFQLRDFNTFLFWLPHAHSMLGMFSRAVYIVPRIPSTVQDRNQSLKGLDSLGHSFILYYRQHLPQDLSCYSPRFLQIYHRELSTQSLPEDQNGFVRAFTSIQELALSDRCLNIRCTETTVTQSRKFQACSGCCVVRYCSQECQKAAWKDKNVPHKSLCSLLKVFQQKTGVTSQQLKARWYKQEETLQIFSKTELTSKDASEISELVRELATWRDAGRFMESIQLTVG